MGPDETMEIVNNFATVKTCDTINAGMFIKIIQTQNYQKTLDQQITTQKLTGTFKIIQKLIMRTKII